MDTLFLNPTTWDLVVDALGNIAMASNPYAVAQDAASAIKLFSGEYWYDTAKGTPYWTTTFGQMPPLQLVKSQAVSAALSVPDVASARCFISGLSGRQVTGQVQVTDTSGQTVAVGFSK